MRSVPVLFVILALFLLGVGSLEEEEDEEPPKKRFVQPVNVGLDFTLPFDISNTLRTVFGGPISVLVAIALGMVLLVGILNVPLGLIMGWTGGRRKKRDEDGEEMDWRRSLELLDFADAFMFWTEKHEACREKVVCHAHFVLVRAPAFIQTAFRLVSQNIRNAADYKEAIIVGLRQDDCEKKFWRCKKSLLDLLPQVTGWKRFLKPFTVNIWDKGKATKKRKKLKKRSSKDRTEL